MIEANKTAPLHDDATQTPASGPATEPEFGYGHPAHRPDPSAAYVFQPGPPRTLPLNSHKRWRVPG